MGCRAGNAWPGGNLSGRVEANPPNMGMRSVGGINFKMMDDCQLVSGTGCSVNEGSSRTAHCLRHTAMSHNASEEPKPAEDHAATSVLHWVCFFFIL